MNDKNCVIAGLRDRNNTEKMVYVIETSGENDAHEVVWSFDLPETERVSGRTIPTDVLPCTIQDIRDLQPYGYGWRGMLPIDKKLAVDLFREGTTIYSLLQTGAEEEVVQESHLHSNIRKGITVEDWLILRGRLRDGEIVPYGEIDESFPPIQIGSGKYRGITKETGEEIEGYLIRCEGTVNSDGTYICPLATECGYRGLSNGASALSFGPFIKVLGNSVVPVGTAILDAPERDELEAYKRTGLSPEEIQDAVNMFSGEENLPDGIKAWAERAAWHVRKCDELAARISTLEKEADEMRARAKKQIQAELIQRLELEQAQLVETFVPTDKIDKDHLATVAPIIALYCNIVTVFRHCDLQYGQYVTLGHIEENLVSGIAKIVYEGKKSCYGEEEIKAAIFDFIHEHEA